MPLTREIPKPLVSVAGKPFLFWQLRQLREQNITRVLLLVSHLGHLIEEHFTREPVPGLSLEFAHEPKPLGTGGALRLALPKLEDKFWLLNGDSFLPLDFSQMNLEPLPNCMAALTDIASVDVPANLKIEAGRVIEYRKGAGAGFGAVDAGVYRLEKEVVRRGPEGRFDLEMLWPALIAAKRLGAHAITRRFFDIGTPDRLKNFEEHVHDYF